MKKAGEETLGKTPMMRQYKEIKNQYPDMLLFYRLGDFYELFGRDAELASKLLDITLTGRDAGLDKRVPMCGVPYHAADSYLARLVEKGYKVAICEQVEDPRQCKGLVKREVVRVITPGTSIETQMLTPATSNYIVAVCGSRSVYGFSFCDVTTGDFFAGEFKGYEAFEMLKDELIKLNPSEILCPEELNPGLFAFLDKVVVTSCSKKFFWPQEAKEVVLNHFSVPSLEALGCQDLREGIACAGAILSYLREMHKTVPQQIKRLELYRQDSYLMIDATTFRNLEITKTIRSNEQKGSLLDILDSTKTAQGARLLRSWLERPLTDKTKLEDRLSAVEVLTRDWTTRQELRNCLSAIYDLERIMTRILYLRALPRELIAFRNSLAMLPRIKKLVFSLPDTTCWQEIKNRFDTLEDVYNLLYAALEDEPPYQLKDGGVIKKGYHQEIDALRETGLHGKEWIARLESEEKEKTGIKSLKIGYNKVFGYYFEVTKANYALVPPYFQRKQTLANAERFITEELINLENQVLGAEEKLSALEEEVYLDLLREVGKSAHRLQSVANILSQIDVLQALAETAVVNNYVRPQIIDCEANRLEIKELRHPMVEKMRGQKPFVPNDLSMPADLSLYIITGPNMGGKSTYCRSVALAVIMAQAGSFVPASSAVISVRDRVFARVGATDDLSSGQSTFMVEMNEVANILRHATKNSLVILDEVGRGTSTYDGLSMAWAVSEYLVTRIGPKALFATHYHELTQLENLFPSIKNLSLPVIEKGEEIVFLHRIIEGPADKSYGIQVGRLAGLPEDVIIRATAILKSLEKEHRLNNSISPPATETPPPQLACDDEARKLLLFLREIDINNMTPLAALNTLHELINGCKLLKILDKNN